MNTFTVFLISLLLSAGICQHFQATTPPPLRLGEVGKLSADDKARHYKAEKESIAEVDREQAAREASFE